LLFYRLLLLYLSQKYFLFFCLLNCELTKRDSSWSMQSSRYYLCVDLAGTTYWYSFSFYCWWVAEEDPFSCRILWSTSRSNVRIWKYLLMSETRYPRDSILECNARMMIYDSHFFLRGLTERQSLTKQNAHCRTFITAFFNIISHGISIPRHTACMEFVHINCQIVDSRQRPLSRSWNSSSDTRIGNI